MNIDALLKLVDTPRDNAMLRFSLGRFYLTEGDPGSAAGHLLVATEMNPSYTAAWKELGRSLKEAGRFEEAETAWRRGIEIAEEEGDKQAGKEMAVFLRRLEKATGD